MYIETIKGKIAAESLGRTYIHEHLKVDLSSHKKDDDTNFDDIQSVIEEMKILKSKGIDGIVEVTNRGMGRDISAMKEIAKASDMNVIASTGFYKEPFLPKYVYEMDEKSLSNLLIEDIVNGIDGTDIKAHVIGEIGTSKDKFTDPELKVFKASVLAHHHTNNPISTHTTLGTMAIEQLDFFEKNGVNLSKVVIGHLDLNCDIDYHLKIADRGSFMAFDTIGKSNYEVDEKRIEHILKLVERGHLNQIMLSLDITRKSHLKNRGGIGYSYLIEDFVPRLIDAGLKEEQINQMLIYNPQKFLGV